jgi:hypothetical protein
MYITPKLERFGTFRELTLAVLGSGTTDVLLGGVAVAPPPAGS